MTASREELEKQIIALRKINSVLMDRVEHSIDSSGNDYAIFEQNILLQKRIEERTNELENSNRQLAKYLKEQTRISEDLQQSEKTFRNIVHASPMGIHLYELQSDDRLVFVGSNPVADAQLDVNNRLFLGKTIEEAFPNLKHTEIPDRYRRAAQFGEGWRTDQFSYDDGKIIGAFEVHVFQMSPGKIAVLFNDITKRKQAEQEKEKLQEELARAQKIESIGLLAGGVAHDLNNILSGTISYPELILLELPKNDKMRKRLELIRESGLRASEIVQDLLTVTRGVAVAKEPINVHAIIEDYLQSPDLKMVKHYHPGVTLSTTFENDSAKIMGSRVHIRKMLMNLVSNSFEACGQAGNVTISLSTKCIDTEVRGDTDIEEGDYVILTVTDQGKGIPREDLEKIFEPFYSKKKLGRSGTGLGLTVVSNVVQDHYGYIQVSSSNKGTQFTLHFPITDKLEQQMELDTDLTQFKGNGETILVVDDINAQRIITSDIVEKLNYRVDSIPSGELAIEYLGNHSVDLVILDMIMDPGISGRETYEQIIQMHPNQKAIIVSGFAETADVMETLRLGAGRFLKKPLTIHELAKAIHSELGN